MVDAKFLEIERTSLLISLFSRFDQNTGMFNNFPYLLGGEGYFSDEQAKESVEQAFGQLNLPDLFKQFEFVLNLAMYSPVKLKADLAITPNVYTIKTNFESIYGMNLILTPYSDINITALGQDLSELIKDYSGTSLRVSHEEQTSEDQSIDFIEKLNTELEESTLLLLRRIYYRLFLDRSLAGGAEKASKSAFLVASLLHIIQRISSN
jgi:hypothetical protein